MRRLAIRWATLVLVVSACAPNAAPPLTAPRLAIVVPATPPDSLPSRYREDLDPQWRARVDILCITYSEDATPEERNAAAAAAGAIELVGGTPLRPTGFGLDGIYIFLVESDGAMDRIFDLIERVGAMPGVVSAFPLGEL